MKTPIIEDKRPLRRYAKKKKRLNIDYNNPDAITMFSAIFEREILYGVECLSEERDGPRQHSEQTDT